MFSGFERYSFHFPSRVLWELGALNIPTLQIEKETQADMAARSPRNVLAVPGSGSGPWPVLLHCPPWVPPE